MRYEIIGEAVSVIHTGRTPEAAVFTPLTTEASFSAPNLSNSEQREARIPASHWPEDWLSLNPDSANRQLATYADFCRDFAEWLMSRQTEDERLERRTRHRNGIGFNCADAGPVADILDNARGRALTTEEHARLRDLLSKYVGQLLRAMEANCE